MLRVREKSRALPVKGVPGKGIVLLNCSVFQFLQPHPDAIAKEDRITVSGYLAGALILAYEVLVNLDVVDGIPLIEQPIDHRILLVGGIDGHIIIAAGYYQ
jgi:hypothetical protein